MFLKSLQIKNDQGNTFENMNSPIENIYLKSNIQNERNLQDLTRTSCRVLQGSRLVLGMT